jgi:hypothetical protein
MPEEKPFFSILVPLLDRTSPLFSFTMDSILSQSFSSYEIIVLDGRKDKHTLDLFLLYAPFLTCSYPSLNENIFFMLNKGVSLAQGEYIHVLSPGEFYLSRHSLAFIRNFVEERQFPGFVQAGCLLRHSHSPPQVWISSLDREKLKKAEGSLNMQPYWFRKKIFSPSIKFDPRYQIQGGYDLVCRLFQEPSITKSFYPRILTDYEYRLGTSSYIIRQLFETFLISYRRFGWSSALFSWIGYNYQRLWKWWMKNLLTALVRE